MTSNNALSNRAQKALEVLENGGQFVKRLERNNYTGREQFQTRLLLKGSIVRGIGFQTFEELSSMLRPTNGGTSVSTYYALHSQA